MGVIGTRVRPSHHFQLWGVSNEIHAGITEACQLKPSELVLNEPEKTREAGTKGIEEIKRLFTQAEFKIPITLVRDDIK